MVDVPEEQGRERDERSRPAQIRHGDGGGVARRSLASRSATPSSPDTPLWFYVLREAELNGGQLRGVGARIVAETFHRAMEGSQPLDRPRPDVQAELGPDAKTFRMVDLLLFAFEGKKKLLNPNGG